jgi:Protein of unknown function (DUF3631)/DnaJ domain
VNGGWADYYRVLGVTKDATAEDIRRAYRRLAKEHHPDRGGDAGQFGQIRDAYAVLSDEARREAYDETYVDGAALLDEVNAILIEYVVFPSPDAAVAATLYAAATHAVSRLEFAARLVIKSPVKRCGKSRLLDVLGQLVACPLMTADLSAAALVHSIGHMDPPTVMLDEADTTFGRALRGDEKTEHLRGLLNAGFTRDRVYRRYNPNTRQVENCATFAMAVLAGIGSLPDTIEDRAVIIIMRRRAEGEQVRRFRIRRDKPRVRALGERLAEWVTPRSRMIGDAEPVMPAGLTDRAEDVWEALVAVADAAGGDWPARARSAALALTAGAEDGSLAELLLADVREAFGDADRLSTEFLLNALHKMTESPWSGLKGKQLDAHGLSRLLHSFGIRPKLLRIGGPPVRGYDRADLADAWNRYLPTPGARYDRYPVTPQVSALPDSNVTDETVTGRKTPPYDQACNGVTTVTRYPRGRGHPTDPAVLEQIRAMHARGVKGIHIAHALGVSQSIVSRTIRKAKAA